MDLRRPLVALALLLAALQQPAPTCARDAPKKALAARRSLAKLRWHFRAPATWTLGLCYSTADAVHDHRMLAVEYPDLDLAEVRADLFLPSPCDDGADCSPLHELVVAADHVAHTVGSFHWLQRFSGAELAAGVILPEGPSRPLNDLDMHRLTLRYLPRLNSGPGMLNVRLTLF